MKKIIKFLLITLISLVTLIVVIAVALPLFFDPNDYKPQLTQLVKEQTGRDLKVPGEIELSVFPWLGVKLGKVELSNARSFGKQAFAKVDKVDVRVELLPLLKKQISIGRVELSGLKLDLQRNKQGKTNWDDLIKQDKTAQPQQKKTAPGDDKALAIASLAVGGVSINNASASWKDQQANQHIQIQDLDLNSGAIKTGEPVKFELATRFSSSAPDIKGTVKLHTTALFNQDRKILTLNNTALNTQLTGSSLPGNKLDAELGNNKTIFNQAKQSLEIEGLTLAAFGAKFYADIKASGLAKAPRYQINLASDEFSMKQVAQQLAIELPATADNNALTRVQLSSKLVGDTNNVTLKPLTLRLDDSNLDGYLQIKNFAKPAIRYQLTLDGINADRYLPPVTENKQGKSIAPASAASSQALQLPTDLLRSLDVKGDIKVNQLQISNTHSEQLQLGTKAKDGVIHLYPIKAKMYKGNYSGDIKMDVRGNTPYLSMNEQLSNINIGPLVKDLLDKDIVEGTANLKAKLTARGTTPENIRKSLNGTSSFQFKDGFVKGVDIYYYKKRLEALKTKAPAPKKNKDAKSEFADLKGTINIKNGIARNTDLTAAMPLARIIGKGTVNLVKETIDYTIFSKFTSSAKVHDGKTYAQINKTPLPVHFKGKLTSPTISVDYQAVLKAEAKKHVDEKKAAAKKKLDEKKKQKEQEAKDKLKQKLDDKLKNLFNR